MAARAPNYALVLAVLIASNLAAYWIREKPMPVLFSARLESLPFKLGDWQGRDLEITQEVRDELKADSLLSRAYVNTQSGEAVGLLVVYRKYGRRKFIHRPELCYPAAGWRIAETGRATLRYGGQKVIATKIVAEKNGARELIVYWFVSGSRTEASFFWQQFRMALDRFQTQRLGWAFVRLNCPIMETEEDSLAQIERFLSAASDPLTKVLTGSGRIPAD